MAYLLKTGSKMILTLCSFVVAFSVKRILECSISYPSVYEFSPNLKP